MEKNKRLKTSEDSCDSDIDPEVNPLLSTVKTIQDLPKEILRLLFGYFTYTEKLISRSVCQDWNKQISSVLSKSSYFELGSIESQEILLNSNADWTRLRISNYGSSALPKDFKDLITTLQLDFSGFPDKLNWKELCSGFPNIKDLCLDLDDRKPESEGNRSQVQLRVIENNFQKILHKLKQLSITFPFNYYNVLKKFLTEFNPETMSLTKLSIKENWSNDDTQNKYRHIPLPSPRPSMFITEDILSLTCDIIDYSSSTLKLIDLDFYSKAMQTELIPNLVSKLCEMKDLKLQSLLIRYETNAEDAERDFSILQEFLNTQKRSDGDGVLKDIILPWSSNRSLCQEFVKSLPQNIEIVGNVCSEHITGEFPTGFKKLRLLSITGDITEHLSDDQCDSIERLHRNARKYGSWLDPDTSYCFNKIMSNLTELKIIWVDWRETHPGFFDEDLQTIISNSHKLQILHLESCDITDNGVTGLDGGDPHIQNLIHTKRLYFYGKFVPEDNMIENPLSSLKMLEELVLIGTRITDVGLVLGLQFGSQLKQLTIESESEEVSDLGLHCLATNNPGLETFKGSFESSKISMVGVGIEHFKKQLPMIEFTRKFRLVNEPPEED